jgi:hypothetical protein
VLGRERRAKRDVSGPYNNVFVSFKRTGARTSLIVEPLDLQAGPPILASVSAAPWPDDVPVPVFGRKGTKGQPEPSKRVGAFRSTVCGIAQSNQRHIFRPDSDRHNQRIRG